MPTSLAIAGDLGISGSTWPARRALPLAMGFLEYLDWPFVWEGDGFEAALRGWYRDLGRDGSIRSPERPLIVLVRQLRGELLAALDTPAEPVDWIQATQGDVARFLGRCKQTTRLLDDLAAAGLIEFRAGRRPARRWSGSGTPGA